MLAMWFNATIDSPPSVCLLPCTADIFPAGQLYIVFSAKDAGVPVEDYVVSNST